MRGKVFPREGARKARAIAQTKFAHTAHLKVRKWRWQKPAQSAPAFSRRHRRDKISPLARKSAQKVYKNFLRLEKKMLRKINFKVIIALALVVLLPFSLMLGCGIKETKFATTVYKSDMFSFYNGADGVDGVAIKQRDYIKNYANKTISSSNLTVAQKAIYENCVIPLNELNNNLYVLASVINADYNSVLNLYDLSEVGLERDALFEIKEKPAGLDNALKSFTLKFDSNQANPLLPTQTASSSLVDNADEHIKKWGTCLNFDIALTDGNLYKINVYGGFYAPSASEITTGGDLNEDGYKIIRCQDTKQVMIVYKDKITPSKIYTKVVSFTADGKKVEKYNGDKTIDTSATLIGTPYYYSYQKSKLTGAYEIRFDANTSYFYVKFTNDTSNSAYYTILETYALQDGDIITRINQVNGAQINAIDFFFGSSGVNAKFKYKTLTGNIQYIKVLDAINASVFAKIAKDETGKAMSFEIDSKELIFQSIGY